MTLIVGYELMRKDKLKLNRPSNIVEVECARPVTFVLICIAMALAIT